MICYIIYNNKLLTITVLAFAIIYLPFIIIETNTFRLHDFFSSIIIIVLLRFCRILYGIKQICSLRFIILIFLMLPVLRPY